MLRDIVLGLQRYFDTRVVGEQELKELLAAEIDADNDFPDLRDDCTWKGGVILGDDAGGRLHSNRGPDVEHRRRIELELKVVAHKCDGAQFLSNQLIKGRRCFVHLNFRSLTRYSAALMRLNSL